MLKATALINTSVCLYAADIKHMYNSKNMKYMYNVNVIAFVHFANNMHLINFTIVLIPKEHFKWYRINVDTNVNAGIHERTHIDAH